MNDVYVCPGCRCEHSEPSEAVLGHLARCESCALLLELLAEERPAAYAPMAAIRVAA
jgi:hypothetical protein